MSHREKDQLIQEDILQPLPQEEMEIALNRIKELHPLAETPIEQVLPNICCILKLCRKKKRHDWGKTVETVLADEEIKEVDERLDQIITSCGGGRYTGTDIVADERKISHDIKRHISSSDDPFNKYGFGIIAYFKLLLYLMYAYIVLCCIAGYMMWIYSKGDALETGPMNIISRYTAFASLGNLGFIQFVCYDQYLKFKNTVPTLKCPKGEIVHLTYSGLKPNKFNLKDIEERKVGNDFCGDPAMFKQEDSCSDLLDHISLDKDFKHNCIGKAACKEFNIMKYITSDSKRTECMDDLA